MSSYLGRLSLCSLPKGNSPPQTGVDPAGLEPASATWTECYVPVTPRALASVSVRLEDRARLWRTISSGSVSNRENTEYVSGFEGVVDIQSQWTARKRERMGVAGKIGSQNPPPCVCTERRRKDGAPSRFEMSERVDQPLIPRVRYRFDPIRSVVGEEPTDGRDIVSGAGVVSSACPVLSAVALRSPKRPREQFYSKQNE